MVRNVHEVMSLTLRTVSSFVFGGTLQNISYCSCCWSWSLNFTLAIISFLLLLGSELAFICAGTEKNKFFCHNKGQNHQSDVMSCLFDHSILIVVNTILGLKAIISDFVPLPCSDTLLGFAILLALTWVLSICSFFSSPLLGALFNGGCQGFSIVVVKTKATGTDNNPQKQKGGKSTSCGHCVNLKTK